MKSLISDSGFKPPYIPGETPYSWVARYQLSRPYQSWRLTNQILFGRENVRINPILPSHLVEIASYADVPVDCLLHLGTGYSLFAYPQGDPQRASKLMKAMLEPLGGNSISHIANLGASRIPIHAYLKFCPICVEEDVALHGSSYWHSEHQMYGVWSCPIHQVYLSHIPCGDGGVNHHYILPPSSAKHAPLAPPKMNYLSTQITLLREILNGLNAPVHLAKAYNRLLKEKHYETKTGRLRWKILKEDLTVFWNELFITPELNAFDSFKDFHFIPRLVHESKPMHYFKHMLLLGFLSKNLSEVILGDLSKRPEPQSNIDIQEIKNAPFNRESVLLQLASGESLRKVSQTSGKSIGYLKQLALRHSIPIDRRQKFISEEIERKIWRQAFIGLNRKEIAKMNSCSTGAVESIIQSHPGLSQWRAHLRHKKQLRKYREEIIDFLDSNPSTTRGKVQKERPGAYTWLFKHDKEWLYTKLPAKKKTTYTPAIDWDARDRKISETIKKIVKSGASLTAIDRQLGGHQWLTKYRDKLPISIQAATSIIHRTKQK